MPTWHQTADFTLEEAKEFLRGDFRKVLKRTKYLYVDLRKCLPAEIGPGFFEPVLLCLCWCDFLGALHCGDVKTHANRKKWKYGSTKRSKRFIEDFLGNINSRYKTAAADIVAVYRHGTVHAYAPVGAFEITLCDETAHLEKKGGRITICIEQFLDDFLNATEQFASTLNKTKLADFNNARRALQ